MKNLIFAITLMFCATTAYAAKPDWAGQGKPDKADIENMTEEAREQLRDRMKDRPGKGKKNKPKKDEEDYNEDEQDEDEHNEDEDNEDEHEEDEVECELTKEECAELRAERKAEKEAERAERKAEKEAERAESDSAKDKVKNEDRGKPEDTGKGPSQEVVDKKVEAEQREQDKGSVTGQEKRQENSRKWWRFWEWGK